MKCVDLSRTFGAPMDRRRLYLILVREDVLSDETLSMVASHDDFCHLIAARAVGMKMDCKHDWMLSKINMTRIDN